MSTIRVGFLATIALVTWVPIQAQNAQGQNAPRKQAATKQAAKKPAARKVNPVFAPPKDDPSLPYVLLIGDSISIGYTLDVRRELKGVANVYRPPTNCGPATKGIAELDAWLGDRKWDVVHWNHGLHDLKYMGPQGQNLADPDAADSHQQVPIDEYAKAHQKQWPSGSNAQPKS